MQPASWTGDFIADVFTDRLHPTEKLSFNDPVPTKCSFGRGKRQEEIPIPRMPKILPFQLKENVSSIGRGLQRKAESSRITKPGMVHSQRKPDQKTDHAIPPKQINPLNLAVPMQPLFLDQNCPLLIQTSIISNDHPLQDGNNVAKQFDVENEKEFPCLSIAADKETTSKQTKIKSQKKKPKKKS